MDDSNRSARPSRGERIAYGILGFGTAVTLVFAANVALGPANHPSRLTAVFGVMGLFVAGIPTVFLFLVALAASRIRPKRLSPRAFTDRGTSPRP